MDPRDRADAALTRARARGAFVVTPDNATSPMDAASTLQIPRSVVASADPESTMVISAEAMRGYGPSGSQPGAAQPTMPLPQPSPPPPFHQAQPPTRQHGGPPWDQRRHGPQPSGRPSVPRPEQRPRAHPDDPRTWS